jgi:hypothetical protein
MMRNIFDQFHQPENQLTHALASVLALNQKLCRRFVRDIAGIPISAKEQLHVDQQHVPGTSDPLDEDERRSLPDACIYGDGSWCLVIESKVAAPLTEDQLRRHRQMVERAFTEVRLLAITAESSPQVPKGVLHRTWSEISTWLRRHADLAPVWSDHLREYLRLFESRMLVEGYHMPGPLTTFDGVPFDDSHPYNYREAKLVLDQMLGLLKKRKSLRALGIDPADQGRPAITGRRGKMVWDLLSLRPNRSSGHFTDWPHLTLGIHTDKVDTMVTVPHLLNMVARKRLIAIGRDGFIELTTKIAKNLSKLMKGKGCQPVLRIMQRHFIARKNAVTDGDLTFDIRTILGNRKSGVKQHSTWINSAYDVFSDKQGTNIQLQFGAWLPHKAGMLAGADAIDRVEEIWLACSPLIKVLLD